LSTADYLGYRRALAGAARNESGRRCDHPELVADRKPATLLAVVHGHEPGERRVHAPPCAIC
jgi:hypothetical protein